MAVTLKYKIIELLSRDLGELYSISDVAKRLGVAYSHTHGFIKALAKDEVLTIKKIGNVSVCKLNLKSPMTLSLLSINSSRRALDWARKNPQSAKTLEKIDTVSDNVHCILVKGSKTIIVVPERISGADFSMFKNRAVMNKTHLQRNKQYYKDAIILHGAEKYWSFMSE